MTDVAALLAGVFVSWFVAVTAVYLGVLGALRTYVGEESPFGAVGGGGVEPGA